jgi:hypothetical protein
MPEKPKYTHGETAHNRFTLVDIEKNPEEQERIKQLDDEHPIVIKLHDKELPEPLEFHLCGFATIRDPRLDMDVLYYKFKPDENLFMYYPLDHPDTPKVVAALTMGAKMHGLEVQNQEDNLKEMVEAYKQKLKGTLKEGAGIHPKMDYIKDIKDEAGVQP